MTTTEQNLASSGLGRQFSSDQIDILDVVLSLKKRVWLILAVAAIVSALIVVNTLRQRRIYQSSASVIVTTPKTAAGSQANILEGVIPTGAGTIKTQVQIMSSPEMIREAYDRLTREEQLKGFGTKIVPNNMVTVRSVDDANLIEVQVKSYAPDEGAKLANAIIDTYLKEDLERNSLALKRGREYVERERKIAANDLTAATSELAEFKERTGIVNPIVQSSAIAASGAELRFSQLLAEKEVQAAQQKVNDIQGRLDSSRSDVNASTNTGENPEYSQLRTQLNTLVARQAEIAQTFTAQSPEMREIDRQVAEMRERLKKVPATVVTVSASQRNPVLTDLERSMASAAAELITSQNKLQGINNQIAQLDAQIASFPELERQYSELDQRVTVIKATLDLLSKSYYSLLIQERSSQPNSISAARAVPATAPSSPLIRRDIVIALILGLISGLLAGLSANHLDKKVHRVADVENLTSLATLSTIPEVSASNEPDDNLLIGRADPSQAYLEAFRMLRNNLLLAKGGQAPRIIAITSSMMGEGKSTVSLNTAISLAMDRKKVILVDVDLRRPTVHVKARVSREFGLTNLIQGGTILSDVVQATQWENLSVLASGPLPPNPSEFLSAPESLATIKSLLEHYDYVVLDCPPCVGLSDMQVISRLSEGVSLVTALERVTKQEIIGAVRMLRQSGAALLGIIINRVKPERGSYYGYYAYGGYTDDGGRSSNGGGKKDGRS